MVTLCYNMRVFFYPACVRIVFSACRRGLQPEKSERRKGQQEGCHEEGPHTHSCFQILFKPDHTPGQKHHLQHSFPFKNSWVSCSQYRSHFETHKNLTFHFQPTWIGRASVQQCGQSPWRDPNDGRWRSSRGWGLLSEILVCDRLWGGNRGSFKRYRHDKHVSRHFSSR